ncbi:MAG: response regulator [Bacteroidota bacterium]
MEPVRHIVIYDDLPIDALRIRKSLRKLPFSHEISIVHNGSQLHQVLEEKEVDILLADYSVPDFTGLQALELIRHKYPFVTFIFVTGTLNDEELAAETILAGASGFVLKHNLSKLPKVIIDALHVGLQSHNKQTRRLVEKYRKSQMSLQDNMEDLLNRLSDTLSNMTDQVEGIPEFLDQMDKFRMQKSKKNKE